MAIVECTECGHKVSDKADICPACGYKVSDIIKDMENFIYCKINGQDVNVTKLAFQLQALSESERKYYKSLFSAGGDGKKENEIFQQLRKSGKREVYDNARNLVNTVKGKINLEPHDLLFFLAEFMANNMEPIEFNGRPYVGSGRTLLPKCPTCTSTNIRKLRAGEKATTRHAILWGRGGAFNKTWKCNNCGHTW